MRVHVADLSPKDDATQLVVMLDEKQNSVAAGVSHGIVVRIAKGSVSRT